MSIPGSINTQIALSKSDKEVNPHSIILKNSLWLVYTRFGRILIKEYNNPKGGQKLSNSADYFTISNSLDAFGLVNPDRFWLWTVENNDLYVTEIEPFSTKPPDIYTKVLFANNVTAARINVFEDHKINILSLDREDIGQTIKFRLYPALDQSPVFDFYLQWDPNRLPTNFSLFKFVDSNQILFSYLKTGSPPNLYLDEYQLTSIYEIADALALGRSLITSVISESGNGSIDGEINGSGLIGSNILTFTNKVRNPVKESILGPCTGAPGVRVRIEDFSQVTSNVSTTSIAGIVGYASKGPFNKIIQIASSSQLDDIFGTGFSNFRFNQGYYAAKAVLDNGGFVEFIRPYGEEVDPESSDKRELKSDTFLVSYDYNPNTSKSIVINHFAATRSSDDGYSIYGTREIFNIEKSVQENSNYDFTLNSVEITGVNKNQIPLLSIINEDPSSTIRGKSQTDDTADKIVVTTANNKISRMITHKIKFTSQPSDGDIIYIYDHNNNQIFFEFDSDTIVSIGNNAVNIGNTLLETLNNLTNAMQTILPYHTFTRNGSIINGSVYYGINDSFSQSTQSDIFTISVDSGSVMTTEGAAITVLNILMDNSIGKILLSLGLATETYLKDSYNGSKSKRYALTDDGIDVAKIFLNVDYVFKGVLYTFYGTIVPYINKQTDIYILKMADSVANGFKVLVNSNVALTNSVQSSNFNLGKSFNPIVVNVATTSNITLAGQQGIDGYFAVVGNKVLVKNQFNPSQNGVYLVKTGSWERIQEMDQPNEFNSDIYVKVIGGTTQINTNWRLTLDSNVFYLGSSNVNFYTTLETNPLSTFFYKYAYDTEDPAVINNSIWSYNPKNIVSSEVFSSAWSLFLERRNSNCDYLVSAGTAIKNLFVRGLEEIDYDVMESMLDVCNLRKNCFAIFDGVDELNIENALQKMAGIGTQGLKSRWGSIFDGRSIFDDRTYTKSSVEAVKSIEVAGLITRNRKGGLYWIPPAGRESGTVSKSLSSKQKYTRKYTNPEDPNSDIARLYDYNINPSRTMDGLTVIYGQKTMLKENLDHNRLNVVMLLCGLNKKLDNILDPRMLKLNNMALRNNLASELRNILQNIASSNPSGLDRFEVICDSSNNTREIISQNKLIVDVKLYPTKTGECITLRTSVLRTGELLSIQALDII